MGLRAVFYHMGQLKYGDFLTKKRNLLSIKGLLSQKN